MIMGEKSEFPNPLEIMPMFVLQVAPEDVHGGYVKALYSLQIPFWHFREISFTICLFQIPSSFFLCDDIQVKSTAVLLLER